MAIFTMRLDRDRAWCGMSDGARTASVAAPFDPDPRARLARIDMILDRAVPLWPEDGLSTVITVSGGGVGEPDSLNAPVIGCRFFDKNVAVIRSYDR
jgi:hypothetical protein